MIFEVENNNTPSLQQARAYINSIDFSMIIEKMVKQDGWRIKSAVAACELYRHFLFLTKKYREEGLLPPSFDIDEFWHYHILDTKKYTLDCQAIFGYYLHHYPYLILDHRLDSSGLKKAFDRLQTLHTKEFGEPIFQVRSKLEIIWQKIKNSFKNLS